MSHAGLESLPFFSETDIAGVLTWDPLIDTMERALVSLSAGEVEQPVRQMVPVPGRDAIIAAMPAVGEAMAVKVVTLFHENAGTGLPTHQAVIMVFDVTNGTPLAVMDGRLITEMRTAAGSAAAARKMAPREPRVTTIMGSGVQARAHAAALATVRPLGEVRLWSRSGETGRAAADDIGATYFNDPEQAVRGADIVACTTSATDPILSGAWLKPGAFVTAVGWNGHDGRELDEKAWTISSSSKTAPRHSTRRAISDGPAARFSQKPVKFIRAANPSPPAPRSYTIPSASRSSTSPQRNLPTTS
jgi:ornithine cyclodeaminase/alanine dehydrogenase-like protein (mu-crystallin family)